MRMRAAHEDIITHVSIQIQDREREWHFPVTTNKYRQLKLIRDDFNEWDIPEEPPFDQHA